MRFGTKRLGAAVLLVLVMSQVGQAQYRAEAYLGDGLGVGKIEVRLPEDQYSPVLGVEGLGISERNGRILYPAIERREIPGLVKEIPGMVSERLPGRAGRVGQLLGGLLDQPPKANVYFLFRGTEPLELTIQSTRTDRVTVRPRSSGRAFQRTLSDWWETYTDQPGLLEHKDDYPPIVQNYMTATLARRYGLELPREPRKSGLFSTDLDERVGLSLATEEVKTDFERRRILGDAALQEPADQPLPAPLDPVSATVPPVPDDLKIEPMAMHVPAECIYIRFGAFTNFLWLQDTLKKWGGDAQNLLSLRGLDYGMAKRIEETIVLEQSAMARVFGPTVIEDVAIIGTDVYFQDGGCFGLLFHAKNNLLLGGDFKRQRAERLKVDKEVTEETVKIAGRDVSLLSTPDGRVRSFYAVDGMFHFVTRSERLMERFLETGADEATSLGGLPAFRQARSELPVEREDTVFIYMSEPFFDNLISPAYRIETRRRLQAVADIELVKLARLAARADGLPDDSVDTLVENGFLPEEFGIRPDGSRAVLENGDVYDALRGRRGSFLPILDVPVESVTATEAADYRRFLAYYQSHWGNLDPVVIGIQRSAPEKKLEKVVVDARMMPLSRSNFERIRYQVGEADNRQFAAVPENLASFEAVLAQQRLFGGLQDVNPPSAGSGSLLPSGILRTLLVGYAGADGPLGPLTLLNLGLFSRPDPGGYAKSALGGWRLTAGSFTLFSFQPEVLANVAPQLQYVEAEKPAQFRLRVGDVAQAKITPLLNDLGYDRTAETSRGNLRLMHQLNQQLGVPLPECLDVAEDLLNAELVCPLGGEYGLEQSAGGLTWWTSPALTGAQSRGLTPPPAPEGFLAPPLNWFRGLDADVQILPDTLNLHAEVLMATP